jgi:hypothetical protein
MVGHFSSPPGIIIARAHHRSSLLLGKWAVSRTLFILIALLFLLAVMHPDTVQIWFGTTYDVLVDVVNTFWPW